MEPFAPDGGGRAAGDAPDRAWALPRGVAVHGMQKSV